MGVTTTISQVATFEILLTFVREYRGKSCSFYSFLAFFGRKMYTMIVKSLLEQMIMVSLHFSVKNFVQKEIHF